MSHLLDTYDPPGDGGPDGLAGPDQARKPTFSSARATVDPTTHGRRSCRSELAASWSARAAFARPSPDRTATAIPAFLHQGIVNGTAPITAPASSDRGRRKTTIRTTTGFRIKTFAIISALGRRLCIPSVPFILALTAIFTSPSATARHIISRTLARCGSKTSTISPGKLLRIDPTTGEWSTPAIHTHQAEAIQTAISRKFSTTASATLRIASASIRSPICSSASRCRLGQLGSRSIRPAGSTSDGPISRASRQDRQLPNTPPGDQLRQQRQTQQ